MTSFWRQVSFEGDVILASPFLVIKLLYQSMLWGPRDLPIPEIRGIPVKRSEKCLQSSTTMENNL